jgi:signal transduction histidine kinase
MQKEKLDLFLFILSASMFILLFAVAIILLFRIYKKSKTKLILEKELMSSRFEQTLLRSKLEIQEQTFSYISKEIHDNIGQVLSLARLNLNRLQAIDVEKLEPVDELLGKAITDLRNLSHSLDTDVILRAGWIKAAQRLLTDLEKTGTCKVIFSAEENLPVLENEKHIILFRMIQEIINNIIKHSKAKEIKFKVTKNMNQLSIDIEDDGIGFDKENIVKGAGLQNLESRSKMIDAKLYIHTMPGSGTRVTIAVNS